MNDKDYPEGFERVQDRKRNKQYTNDMNAFKTL